MTSNRDMPGYNTAANSTANPHVVEQIVLTISTKKYSSATTNHWKTIDSIESYSLAIAAPVIRVDAPGTPKMLYLHRVLDLHALRLGVSLSNSGRYNSTELEILLHLDSKYIILALARCEVA